MYSKENSVVNQTTDTIDPRQWVTRYADYLYAYALNRINDKDKARDLVQETFLAALENVEKFEGRSSEKTWLTSILKYKIFDLYRAHTTAIEIDCNMCDAEGNFFRSDDGHWNSEHRPKQFTGKEQDLLEKKEFHEVLKKCIKKLPGLWTAVFTLKFMDDYNAESICEKLKITRANYWVIIHRAKVNLRSCLQKNWL